MWKASSVYWIVQFLGWGLFCSLIGITKSAVDEFDTIVAYQLIILFFLLVSISHLMRYILIKFDWINLKIVPLIPRILGLNYLSAITLIVITSFVSKYILYTDLNGVKLIDEFINSLVYTLFFLLWTAVYLTYHLLQKSRQQELLNLQLEASHHEIELKTLRDQLNPHFLFNSLNSIRALVEADPKTAKTAVTSLSNLLRNSLQMGRKSQVSLGEELELVNEYLKLEKIRFEERLNVKSTISAPKTIKIPPFIIQTLVENAIKHGISKIEKGGDVEIEITKTGRELKILVKNTGQLNTTINHGVGLSNTQKRLNLIYGNNAIFVITRNDNKVESKIVIKYKE